MEDNKKKFNRLTFKKAQQLEEKSKAEFVSQFESEYPDFLHVMFSNIEETIGRFPCSPRHCIAIDRIEKISSRELKDYLAILGYEAFVKINTKSEKTEYEYMEYIISINI